MWAGRDVCAQVLDRSMLRVAVSVPYSRLRKERPADAPRVGPDPYRLEPGV